MTKEHAQATAQALPKKHNSQERSRPLKVSLTGRAFVAKGLPDRSQQDLFCEDSIPFIEPKIGSPLGNLPPPQFP